MVVLGPVRGRRRTRGPAGLMPAVSLRSCGCCRRPAVAWADEEWRWLTIAHYVRWAVRSEAPGATPSMMTQVLRLADSIGLSPAGLLLNGWTIPTTADGSATESAATPPQQPDPPRRRLRAVKDDDDDPAN